MAPSFSILSQRKSPSSLAQPITYAVPLSLPGAGQGRSSHHNENLVKSLALFVLALRGWFGAVDKIAIVADIVNHTKELLTATSLQVGKTFIYGYMNTKSKAYGLYSFARMKYLTCLENYFSWHLGKKKKNPKAFCQILSYTTCLANKTLRQHDSTQSCLRIYLWILSVITVLLFANFSWIWSFTYTSKKHKDKVFLSVFNVFSLLKVFQMLFY